MHCEIFAYNLFKIDLHHAEKISRCINCKLGFYLQIRLRKETLGSFSKFFSCYDVLRIVNILREKGFIVFHLLRAGAPNEDVVQNHLT